MSLSVFIAEVSRRDLAGEEDVFAWDTGFSDRNATWCFVAVCGCGIDLTSLDFMSMRGFVTYMSVSDFKGMCYHFLALVGGASDCY